MHSHVANEKISPLSLGDPDFLFEYMDILLTANTKLCKHMDYLDDMTEGYDYCVVHSRAQDVEGVSCEVSIVVT